MWGNNTASTPSHTYRYQTITNIVAQPQKNTVDCSKFSNFTSDKIINNLHQNPDTILHTVQTLTNISTPLLKQNTILLISTDLIIPTQNYSRSQQPKKSSTQSNLLQHTYKKISNLDPYNINKIIITELHRYTPHCITTSNKLQTTPNTYPNHSLYNSTNIKSSVDESNHMWRNNTVQPAPLLIYYRTN